MNKQMFAAKSMSIEKKRFIIDIKNYKINKIIKTGGFGSVYLVEDISTKDQCAAKIIITPENNSKFKKMINIEIGILIRCQHPTIIKFIGYSYQDFYGQNNITILLEHAQKGSLADILHDVQRSLADKNYTNTARQKILIGIARAMKHIHENNIIHRDLKPGNVLIDSNLNPKITDFGLSKINETAFSTQQSMKCGTNIYMAPEMIEEKRCSGKVDVYSFGILMYEVVTDSIPFPLFESGQMTLNTLHQKIVNENYRPVFNTPVKKSIKKLIERCWAKDPNDRPNFDEIFKKLAYNIEDSIYDICEEPDDDDVNKYYLDDVDEDEIFLYLDEIENESKPNDEIEKIYQKLAQFEGEIKSLNDENSQLKDENKKLSKSVLKLKTKLQKMNDSIETIQNENDELKNSIETIQNENDELKNSIKKVQNQYGNFEHEHKLINIQISALNQKINFDNIDYSEEQSRSIELLKEEVIHEKKSIDDFNNLTLKSQNTILINVITRFGHLYDPFLEKLLELYTNLIIINQDESRCGLQIFKHTNGKNQILIPSNIVEKMHASNSLFLDILIDLNNISIELKYPWDKFFKVLDIIKHYKSNGKMREILRMKKKEKKERIFCGIKIAVFITGNANPDNGLNGNEYIDSIRFDSCVTQIGNTYSSFMMISLSSGPFENCLSLTQIEIPPSVTFIGYKAFYNCRSLSKVVIPNSVITISEYAFAYCSSLSNILIPNSVTLIGDYAFYECTPSFQVSVPRILRQIGKEAFPSKAQITRY